MSGGGGWRLSLVRLVEKGGIPEIQAVCVVSKVRARSGKTSRMWALAVQKEMRGRGLVAEAMRRLHVGGAGVGGWVRLQAGGRHGCLHGMDHGGGRCGLLCHARLG